MAGDPAEALEGLSCGRREVFVLRDIEELSTQETAGILGHRLSRPGYIVLVFNCERNLAWSGPSAVMVRARTRYLEFDDSHEQS